MPVMTHDNAEGAPPSRVLILARYFPPEPESGAARPGRFARYLPGFGYEPIVIGGDPPAVADGPTDLRRTATASPARAVRWLAGLGAVAQRHLLPYNDALPWAVHAAAEASAVLDRWPVAAIVSTSPPVGCHLAALWLKRRYGVPWVADFRDPLRGNPFRARWWPFPYDAPLERLLVRHADALVANTDALAALWRRHHPNAARKVSVIWNGFDPEDRVEPRPLPETGRRALVHVGSLYGGRHPGALLSSLARLIHRGELAADRVRVRFVGYVEDGCLRKDPAAVDALHAWGCLEYDGQVVPTAQARQAAAQADYLLLLDLNERDAGLQVPGKLFEYLQIGRPILAFTRPGSPTAHILERGGVPHRIVATDASNAEVDRQVRDLFDLPTTPVRASDWFEEHFDGRNQTRTLAHVLDALTAAVRPPSPPGSRGHVEQEVNAQAGT